MNTLAIVWKAVSGFLNPFGDGIAANIAEYALGKLNAALDGLSVSDKGRVQATLNLASRVLALLCAVAWLVPTKWQTAFKETVDAVQEVCAVLSDLNVKLDELANVKAKFVRAYVAWQGDDDETCVE